MSNIFLRNVQLFFCFNCRTDTNCYVNRNQWLTCDSFQNKNHAKLEVQFGFIFQLMQDSLMFINRIVYHEF